MAKSPIFAMVMVLAGAFGSAQVTQAYYYSSAPEEGDGAASAPQNAPGFTAATVQGVVPNVEGASVLCRQASVYAVDCLANQYEEMARELGDSRRNAEARAILQDTADDLRQIARQNQSQTLPAARLRTQDNTIQSSRPLVAVDPARQERAAAQAIAAIDEAQTKLLRSDSSANKLVYAQIASAMESNKVLLRSS